MGRNEEEWTYLADVCTKAGADIIECNFSCPHMSGEGLGSDVGTNKDLVIRYTAATRRGTTLPILAKMTPNITNMEVPAIAAIENGATGIAAINTIKSIMNINLDTFASGPDVSGKSAVGGYSGKAVKPIALRFIPTLLDETDKIMKAQMSRGADFESSNLINRAKNLVPLLVPLFVSAFRRADELAMAMEARCYRGGYNRTKMRQAVITTADKIAYLLMILFLAGSIASRFIHILV